MAIDVYFYANGNDPFTFPLGAYTVHVYVGAPPLTTPGPATGSSPGIQVTPTPGWRPTHRTPIPPPIALDRIHDAGEMRDWLNEAKLALGDQPVQFRLDAVSGSLRPEIPRLLEGLQDFGEHQVSVEIVGWSEPGDG
jgi:hypothetical protein